MPGPRIVIIGAGVVGASLADELTESGYGEVTLLEQGPLPAPGGSTSHAPGLVFQANSSKVMVEMATYTRDKFVSLSRPGKPGFLEVGGLEISTSPERDREIMRRHGWLTAFGVDARLVDTAEAKQLHPLINEEVVSGGLYIPTDGLAKAVNAVEAMCARAASRGATVRDNTQVRDIVVEGGKVTGVVVAARGSGGNGSGSSGGGDSDSESETIAADVVVACAGIWGPRISAMVGLTLPLTPLAHQLAWTTDLPSLAGQSEEAVRPILRNQDADLYYRDRFGGLGIGSYLHDPMPLDAGEIREFVEGEAMPSSLDFTQVDFDPAWDLSVKLLPDLANARIESGFNGLFSFTSDGMPLCGPSPDVEGFWVAEAVWVTHSAGVGRAMAEWLRDGYVSTFDVAGMDISRFDDYQLSPAYNLARNQRGFIEVYDIIHPLDPPADLRPIRTSPFYARQAELGASFLEASGYERPYYYEANADLVEKYADRIPTPNEWAAKHWSPIVGAEALATREGVAMYDMTALKHFEVTGRGAAAFLNRLVTADVDKSVGSVTYCLMLDEDGGIRSDVTVTRLGPETFQVGGNGPLDLAWMRAHLPEDGTVHVADVTGGWCCLGVWGPRARDLVQPLTDVDLTALKYFRGAQGYLGTVPVTMLRLSYVGELGWEIYTTAEHGQKLWDTLWEAGQQYGLIAAGRGAFSSMRLEKGYRSWGSDMCLEHDPYAAGLGFAVKKTKTGYIGEEALAARKDTAGKQLVCLTWEDPGRDGAGGDEAPLATSIMGKEPVMADGSCVGYVTSAGYGYTIGKNIALAWVDSSLASPGTTVSIRYFDHDVAATVTEEPLFDPGMERLRA